MRFLINLSLFFVATSFPQKHIHHLRAKTDVPIIKEEALLVPHAVIHAVKTPGITVDMKMSCEDGDMLAKGLKYKMTPNPPVLGAPFEFEGSGILDSVVHHANWTMQIVAAGGVRDMIAC